MDTKSEFDHHAAAMEVVGATTTEYETPYDIHGFFGVKYVIFMNGVRFFYDQNGVYIGWVNEYGNKSVIVR